MPPHAPCRLQPPLLLSKWREDFFASTRSVQIATVALLAARADTRTLPPHAPCRLQRRGGWSAASAGTPLPPHAPCRLQPVRGYFRFHHDGGFASTRSVQIATKALTESQRRLVLCLHTLRADCNMLPILYAKHPKLCLHTLRADCNGRNAQNCNMHFSERVLSR